MTATDPLPPTLGFVAADWIETFCTQGPGDHQDQLFHLTDDQLKFLLDVYELEPGTGKRRYRRAAFIRGKGAGKSSLAAAICLFEALGPCRFSHWDANGNPVGKPVVNPQIRVAATEETQAGNVFDGVIQMAREGPLAGRPGIDVGMTRVLLPDGGSIRPVTASAAARDGGRETFYVMDEGHLWQLPEMHRLHQTIIRNLAKRAASQAWSLEVSTVHAPGMNSVLESTVEYGHKLLNGEASDWRMLFDHRAVPNTYDLNDPEQRMAALQESYGESGDYVDLAQMSALWDDPQTVEDEWRRYFLSQIVSSADSFIDPADWAAVADASLSLHDRDMICIGLDTSLIDDGTAVIAARVSDGLIVRLGYWQRPADRRGVDWQVPYSEVDSVVRQAFERYRVLRLYADPQYVHSYLDQWQLDFPKKIFSWSTNRNIPMAAALQRFYVAVKSRDQIAHDGDSLLAQHVANARTHMSQGRVLVRKEYRHSPKKIDALIASVLSYEARADAISNGEDQPEAKVSRRVHGFR